MRPPRRALLFGMLLLMPAFAGCNIQDWYNQMGTVRIQLDVQPAQTSHLADFRSVKAVIYGVTLTQLGDALNPKQFTFGPGGKIVDIVQHGKSGEAIGLAEFRTNLRATEGILVRMVVFEAIESSGTPMEICRVTSRPERFPCFYQPQSDALEYDAAPFAPPRGGEVVVHFPVAIKYAQQGTVAEYFLFADPALVELENRR